MYAVDPSDKDNRAYLEHFDYNNEAILLASNYDHIEVVKLLLGSDKITLGVKTQGLKELQLKSSSKLSHDMNYDNIEKLAMGSLRVLIRIGNQNLQDREIIMTKYFWWLRLEILYNMTNIKEDPFKLALQLEQ